MLRRIGVALSVGLADSINPTTVGPALYLATGPKAVRSVTQFTLGTWAVNFIAGLLLTIGPGRLLLGLVPHPGGTARHVIELVAGVVLLWSRLACGSDGVDSDGVSFPRLSAEVAPPSSRGRRSPR